MTIEEKLDRLTSVVEAQGKLADSLLEVANAHNEAIQGHQAQIEALVTITANLERQWQAYINTPRQ